MTTSRTVLVSTSAVGQAFGTRGVLRDPSSRRIVARCETVRPHGFVSAALDDARALAEKRGWTVEDGE